MTGPVIADASPLIALASTRLLDLLRELYGTILVPSRVYLELHLADTRRPGVIALSEAEKQGWLMTARVKDSRELKDLLLILDPGEAEAILLAKERSCRFLLIDERRGRAAAESRGIPVVGTGGVLVAAKRKGLLPSVSTALDQLTEGGYRLSISLQRRILELAGEGHRKG